MGLRFNKHISLGKHFRLNISKSGVGISGGVKGARISYNPKTGYRTSVGLPGTGLYYSEQHKVQGNKIKPVIPYKRLRSFGNILIVIAFVLYAIKVISFTGFIIICAIDVIFIIGVLVKTDLKAESKLKG